MVDSKFGYYCRNSDYGGMMGNISGRCFCGSLPGNRRGHFLWRRCAIVRLPPRCISCYYVSWFGVLRLKFFLRAEGAVPVISEGSRVLQIMGAPASFERRVSERNPLVRTHGSACISQRHIFCLNRLPIYRCFRMKNRRAHSGLKLLK